MPRIRAAGLDDVGAVLAVWTGARSAGADRADTREEVEVADRAQPRRRAGGGGTNPRIQRYWRDL